MGALYNTKPVIYGMDINSLVFDEKRIAAMPFERARDIRSIRFLDDRKRSFAAGLLLEAVLGRSAFSVRRHESGKPYIDGGPYFSVSHSGDLVILAVCEENVGCDIEFINPYRDTALVARRVFQPEEIETVKDDVKMFYKVWTAKESYQKMTGALSVSGFSVQLEGCGGRVNGHTDVSIRFFDQFDGYAAAVCSPAGVHWPHEISVLDSEYTKNISKASDY
jgi:4'-phosphopantetheinyl transferase